MTKAEKAWLLPPAAVCLAAGILIGRCSQSVLYALAACAAGIISCIFLRNRLRILTCLLLSVAVGCVCGTVAYHPVLPEEKDYHVTGIISDEIRSGANNQFKTVLTSVTLDGHTYPSGAYWTFYTPGFPENLYPGKQVAFTASLYHPQGMSNPDGYDFREELLRRNITIGLYGTEDLTVQEPSAFSLYGFSAFLRCRLSERFCAVLGNEAGGYASAMLFGRRDMIASSDRTAFAKLGIAHVLSVSGFHVGILVGILALLFRVLHIPQKWRIVLYTVILAFYCFLCGLNRPVIRASLLILTTLLGKILNRPRSGLHLLSAVFIVMLIASPVQLTGLSFLLTFGAMLGLILITPWLSSLIRPKHRFTVWLWNAFSAGLGAQLGILLPELYFFQELPLLGLLTNIPVTLIASVMIMSYWIVFALLPVPILSGILAMPAKHLTSWLVSVIRTAGSIPGITLWTRASSLLTVAGVLLLFTGMCCFLRLRPRIRILMISVAVTVIGISLLPVPHNTTEYYQFSVGDADAAILWDHDRVVVIDTGAGDGVVSGFLHRRRLTPDTVILTHLHADHASGLQDLTDNGIPIPMICLPEGAEDQQIHPDIQSLLQTLHISGTQFTSLSAGNTLTLPSGTISVLWPVKGRIRKNQDANSYSLVLRFDLDGVSLLQTGDLTSLYEMYAAAPSDILKVAHHGSSSSTSHAFMQAVSPQAALLSCGRDNRVHSFTGRFPELPLYATATDGCLTVRFLHNAFQIEPFIRETEK